MLIIEICAGVVGIPSLLCYLKDIDYRGKISSLCEFLSDDPALMPDLTRDAFARCYVPSPYMVAGHSHPTAAAYRTSATSCAKTVASTCGSDLYFIQMSRSDQRKGYKGSRQTWWAKDTNVENRCDSKKDDDMLAIVDTDYFIDMPHLLSGKPRPVLLYTAVPSEAATQLEDTYTCFNEDGELETIVAGGGRYKHLLWDYAYDSLVAKRYFLGVLYRLTTYAVERKQVSPHRQLILLTPIKVYEWPVCWIATWLIADQPLRRFNPIAVCNTGTFLRPNKQKFVRFKIHKQEGTFVTTARPGEALCSTICLADDNAIAAVARMCTTNLMIPTTATWMPNPGSDPVVNRIQKRAATITTEFHRHNTGFKEPFVFPVELGVRNYQFEPHNYVQDKRSKIEAFMTPLVHSAFCGDRVKANTKQAIKGRITDLKQSEPAHCPVILQFMEEFVGLVCGDAELHPCDYDEIANHQTSAPQRVSLRTAVTTGMVYRKIVKSFIKGEVQQNVKDERIITTFESCMKLMLAQFARPASEHMKQFDWYGPGKTPVEIAMRMTEICRDANELNVSDFERLDGTVTYFLRMLDTCVLLRLFKAYRAVLNDLLSKTSGNTAYLDDEKYEQGPQQGSGCSLTSFLQTVRTAFCSYCAYRNIKTEYGYVHTPLSAFNSLGIHNGDDGADPDLPIQNHSWAAKKLGLRLEASSIPRGQPGVSFLARYYSDEIWYGRADSMCDIKRQLSKFHTTVRLPSNVQPEQKLVEKAMAYVATDGNTPIIGELCKTVLQVSAYRPQTPLGVGYWWGRFEESTQYPNSNAGGWMDVELERLFPEFDRIVFNNWLATARSPTILLSPPLCAEPVRAKPKVPVVVDGEIVEPEPAPAAQDETLLHIAPNFEPDTESPPTAPEPARPKPSRRNKPKHKRNVPVAPDSTIVIRTSANQQPKQQRPFTQSATRGRPVYRRINRDT